MNNKEFKNLRISKEMLINLNKIKYEFMTPIQEKALPLLLEGKDIIGQAKTGSGKTATFGIALLEKLNTKIFRIQSLILCPTRELAEQVTKELRLLAKFTHNIKILTLVGGASFGQQLGSLRHGAHIVVGTPGRILKHLDKGTVNLNNLNMLVLDEADRMLDMGFIEEIEKILSYTSKEERQTVLFSATYPIEIIEFSKKIQKNADFVKTENIETLNKISEYFYNSNNIQKLQLMINIFSKYNPENCIVFCNTKVQTDILAKELQKRDIDALALHGDMEQYDRNDVLVQFTNKSARILVATDVAARGLDIKELSMVMNYDLPHNIETYIHRIGRTGRAGAEGLAFTFYTEQELEKIIDYKDERKVFIDDYELKIKNNFEMKPKNITLVIEGGKKDKLRAGDILGALTSGTILKGNNIGKIDIYDRQSYVAIEKDFIDLAKKKLSQEKIKNKKFTVWIL